MINFGSGYLYGNSTATNSTPRKFGTLQDVTFDFTFTTKELYGQQSFAVDVRRGEGKFTGKAKFANISGGLVNDIFFGQSATPGLILSAIGELGTIPAATPYTVTVVNAAAIDTDLGVVYATTGLPFTKVASNPVTGQYAEASGVYTFSAGDAGIPVLIDYLYTTATGGTRIALTNQIMGTTPTFMAIFTAHVGPKVATLKLNQCTSTKLSFATKIEDYAIPEMDFSIMVDSSNTLGWISFAD
jgi:hypothetical protein